MIMISPVNDFGVFSKFKKLFEALNIFAITFLLNTTYFIFRKFATKERIVGLSLNKMIFSLIYFSNVSGFIVFPNLKTVKCR